MKLDEMKQVNEVDKSAKWFRDDELYYAQPEIFRLVEDGDLQGLNEYLMMQYTQNRWGK